MKRRLANYIRDLREGARILCTRAFWRAFYDYYKPEALSARLDEWTSHMRARRGLGPDWKLERRIARHRAENPPESDSREQA